MNYKLVGQVYPSGMGWYRLLPTVGRTVPPAHRLNKHSRRAIGTESVPYRRPIGAYKLSVYVYEVLKLAMIFSNFLGPISNSGAF